MVETFRLHGSFHPHTHWNGTWSSKITNDVDTLVDAIPESSELTTTSLEDTNSKSFVAETQILDDTKTLSASETQIDDTKTRSASETQILAATQSISQISQDTTSTTPTATLPVTNEESSTSLKNRRSTSFIKKNLKRSSSYTLSNTSTREYPFRYTRFLEDETKVSTSVVEIKDISQLVPKQILDETFTVFLPLLNDTMGDPIPLLVAKRSEWRGSFSVALNTASSCKISRTISDRFILTLSPPEQGFPYILKATGEGCAAVGMYTFSGTWNLETMMLDVEKVYTGAPKVKVPPRPRTFKAKQSLLTSATSGAVLTGVEGSNEIGVETSAQIAARRVSGRQRIPNKLLIDSTWDNEDSSKEDENDITNEGGKKRQKSLDETTLDTTTGMSSGKNITATTSSITVNSQKKRSRNGPVGAWGAKRSLPVGFPGPAHRFHMMHGRDHMAQPGTQVFLAAHVIPASLEPVSIDPSSVPYSTASAGAAISTDRSPGAQQLSLASGCIYEGEMLSGRPHGFGALVYSNGLMYEGSFLQGREHGWGILSDPDDKTLYEGELVDGVFHGAGIYSYGNGDRYCGGWKNGLPHGRGVFTSFTGASYDGEFVDGQRHGLGIMTFSDGSIYNGYWRSNMKHGKGEITILTKSLFNEQDDHSNTIIDTGVYVYKGNWINDIMDGKGEIIYTDGSSFEGSIKDGKRDGRGTYTFSPGGEQFSGKFIADAIFAATSNDPLTGTVFMKNTSIISSDEIMIPIATGDLKGLEVRVGFNQH